MARRTFSCHAAPSLFRPCGRVSEREAEADLPHQLFALLEVAGVSRRLQERRVGHAADQAAVLAADRVEAVGILRVEQVEDLADRFEPHPAAEAERLRQLQIELRAL